MATANLARVGLVSIDPAPPARTVQMHPSVQAAVRAYLPPADFEQAVLAAAEALLQAWPEASGEPGPPEQDPLQRTRLDQVQLEQAQFEQAQFEQALRDCTGAAAGGRRRRAAPGPQRGQHARPRTQRTQLPQ